MCRSINVLKNEDFIYLRYLIMCQHIIKGFSQLIRHFLDLQLFSIDLILRQDDRWLSLVLSLSQQLKTIFTLNEGLEKELSRG